MMRWVLMLWALLAGWGAVQAADEIGSWEAEAQRLDELLGRKQFDQALELGAPFLERTRREWGNTHPNTAQALGMVARLYYLKGQYARAEPLLVEARVIRERSFGRDHPKTVDTLESQAALYMALKNWDKAEPLLVETLESRRRQWGDGHPGLAVYQDNLGLLHMNKGRPDKARIWFIQGLQLRKKIFAADVPRPEDSLINLAELARGEGHMQEAEARYADALRENAEGLAVQRLNRARIFNDLGALHWSRGDVPAGERYFDQALVEVRDLYGPDNPKLAVWMSNLGRVHYQRKDYARAALLLKEALAITSRTPSATDPQLTAAIRENLAVLARAAERDRRPGPLRASLPSAATSPSPPDIEPAAPAPVAPPPPGPEITTPFHTLGCYGNQKQVDEAWQHLKAKGWPGFRKPRTRDGVTLTCVIAGPFKIHEEAVGPEAAPPQDHVAPKPEPGTTAGILPPLLQPAVAMPMTATVGIRTSPPQPTVAPAVSAGTWPRKGDYYYSLGCFGIAEYLNDVRVKLSPTGLPAFEKSVRGLTCLFTGPFVDPVVRDSAGERLAAAGFTGLKFRQAEGDW
ncbi:MAG: tetratricopeptide repeat protein [Magnetococcales bacterium]|nr:tetratricopeptide repeat protein [Magnetococcales bacterium]